MDIKENGTVVRKSSSWWRNLVMDDDKISEVPTPEVVVTNENQGANGALDEHHRNISTISMGDSKFAFPPGYPWELLCSSDNSSTSISQNIEWCRKWLQYRISTDFCPSAYLFALSIA
ncbi:hypothetical protein Aduo_013261 [Ancylostoma duodenale]